MLSPQKHIRLSESLLGLGANVLNLLSHPQTPEQIYDKLKNLNFLISHDFEHIILALDFLYACGAIELNEQGKVVKCS
ncbi:ABC-three component system middle component 6 [Desulfobotulus pelophilus]|uniref:ABC-three component system middle component 6 n=1 Tax=Desulfobotulus pelophilus TaxID=2823377 RepID=UPI0034A3DE54